MEKRFKISVEDVMEIEGKLNEEGIDWDFVEVEDGFMNYRTPLEEDIDDKKISLNVITPKKEEWGYYTTEEPMLEEKIDSPIIDNEVLKKDIASALKKNIKQFNESLYKAYESLVDMEERYGSWETDLNTWYSDKLKEYLIDTYGLKKEDVDKLFREIEDYDIDPVEEREIIENNFSPEKIKKEDIEKCEAEMKTVGDFLICLSPPQDEITGDVYTAFEGIVDTSYLNGTCKRIKDYEEDIKEEYGKEVYDELYHAFCERELTEYD